MSGKVKIIVMPGGWGEGQVTNIKKLLESVAFNLSRNCPLQPSGEIHVSQNPLPLDNPDRSPMILNRPVGQEYFQIWLTSTDRRWAQYSYQFAHEFCHFLSGFEKFTFQRNKWFHEAVCELASIWTIKQMAKIWKERKPPYPEWKPYIPSLESYSHDLIVKHQLPDGVVFRDWFDEHREELEADHHLRELNGKVSLQMLPLFEAEPRMWQCVRFMPDTNDSFEEFLAAWEANCPAAYKGIVGNIANLISITVPASPPPAPSSVPASATTPP